MRLARTVLPNKEDEDRPPEFSCAAIDSVSQVTNKQTQDEPHIRREELVPCKIK